MKWPSWFRLRRKRTVQPSLTACPECGNEMDMVEKFDHVGDDMRTYRCNRCQEEHIVNFGVALWKLMSDANKTDAEEEK